MAERSETEKHQQKRKRRGPYGKRDYDAALQPQNIHPLDSGIQVLPSEPKVKIARTEHVPCEFEENDTVSDDITEDVADQPCEEFNMDEIIQQILTLNDDDGDSDTDDSVVSDYIYDDEDDYFSDAREYVQSDTEEGYASDFADNRADPDFKPLYPGSSVTIGAFMLLLAIFTTKYNLVGDATQQLLNIIGFALPNDHKLCSTLHEFKKYFITLKNPLVYHYYCSSCQGLVEDTTRKNCPFGSCGKPFDKKKASYFLEIPLQSQIQNLFMQEGFFENLQHRFNRSTVSGVYEDIYDGNVYMSHFDQDGILRDPHNISFTFNTDGAPVFKSSKVSVWPIFMVINELPYKMRMKKENMILASLWFGNQKPSMGTFLKPFQRSMKELYNGIKCHVPGQGTFTTREILLCGTADLPARSLLCNHIQYNGAYSCWKCEQEGTSEAVGRGHARVYPFIENDPIGPAQNVLCKARQAVENQNNRTGDKIIKGIKGPSWLLFFPTFDIIAGIAIDYMHGVLLGVQKMLLELWFLTKYSNKNFNFSHKQEILDQRLMQIRPTLDITRLPRSIQDLKYWKSSEYRSFLLYFGAPVLHDILDKTRFSHFLLLVNSMHILLKCGSTNNDINKAEEMLVKFCKHFEELYDRCFLRLNVHQLLHLPQSVRNLGPLYTHSCFSFEDKNGVLLKMIKGTQCIDNQIVTGVSFVQKLPELKDKCIAKGSLCEKIYNSIEYVTILKRTRKLEEGVYVLGGVKERMLSEKEQDALLQYVGHDPLSTKLRSFGRIELHGDVIYGTSYSRMVKKDNSVVEYKNRQNVCFGRVRSSSSLM